MKQALKTKIVFSLLSVAAALLPIITYAQDPGEDPDVPIDGGLTVLIAAGVGYGIKKVRDERKKRNTSEL
ncbi:hypothetical protein EXU57_03910 [Segetibacter sp. 3557_3]|uniref:PID-CTERM protein-sorting domain-containing protein n=1 Tax=Segetibacter sp. 3557_3 TaxID=2547429 RepID=UPI001058AC2F|nr:hypothetical protein [Segetibacter sp. 3557_3]TDH29222.1 hypothetical protein EXU57_03910 [Segetibacter sp. 3557_3]